MQPPSYPVFNDFPVSGPARGPVRVLTERATAVKLTLSGQNFVARVQISNATPDNTTPRHLFVPPDESFDTVGTLTPADPPSDIMAPVQYVRILLDSGTLTGGNIAESHSHGNLYGIPAQVRQETVILVDERLGVLMSTKSLLELSKVGESAGGQFVDGNRWVWASAGQVDGGTVVAASDGGVWVREFSGPLDVRWFGAKGDGVTDDSDAITAAITTINRLAPSKTAVLHFPPGIFMISQGWLLADHAAITGERGSSILRLRDNLPRRNNEQTQTAVFMGMNAWNNLDTGICRGIQVTGITFELIIPPERSDAAIDAQVMQGGIKLVNPHDCRITDNIFRNCSSFAIQLRATSLQSDAVTKDYILAPIDKAWGIRGNVVQRNRIENPTDWYLSGGRINYTSSVGLSVAGTLGPLYSGGKTSLFSQDGPDPNYVAPNCTDNVFSDNVFIGGSHGAYITSASRNDVSRNQCSGHSHRGLAFAYNCEYNTFSGNRISDVGSAGIHFAYGCKFNVISGNAIARVGLWPDISGGEYYGIKGYVGIAYNTITGNAISDCKKAAISLSHGIQFNVIGVNNLALGLLTPQPGTVGVEINATREAQYGKPDDPADGLKFNGMTLEARGNVITGNNICNTDYGVMLTDDLNRTGSVVRNLVGVNSIHNCKTHGVSTNGRTSEVVLENVIEGNSFGGNGANIVADLRTGGSVLLGNLGDATVRGLMTTSPNSAKPANGETPTKAEFDALLNEVRDLKNKLGNAL